MEVKLAWKVVVKFEMHDEAHGGACCEVIKGGPLYDEVRHEDF